jgi:hypothetical protein
LHERLFIAVTAHFYFCLKSHHSLLFALRQEGTVQQSQDFLENAENCAQLAERAADEPTYNRYKRMEAAWRALAEEQDWLDGEVPPVRIAS